jgi:hypothetical protein
VCAVGVTSPLFWVKTVQVPDAWEGATAGMYTMTSGRGGGTPRAVTCLAGAGGGERPV